MYQTKNGYTPSRGDIVWVNFDPALGSEIKKRRPGLVISKDEYNQTTGFCVIVPITSTDRPPFIKIENSKTTGFVNPQQGRWIDFTIEGRNVTFKERSTPETLAKTLQAVRMYL